ncbi:MAG: nucleotidyltransferase [Myxococcales bacterium]|nr:nucleotidyltransferase [Myxococcales bacterium]
MVADFAGLLGALAAESVEAILIGGLAAQAHGAARLTQDVDMLYRRTSQNIDRLVAALSDKHPYLRGAPPGLPFRFDAATVHRGLNFTLTTDLGDLDLLGEMAGGGTYEQVLEQSMLISVFGYDVRVLSLSALIRAKRAAGRPKDFEAIAELEALLDEIEDP